MGFAVVAITCVACKQDAAPMPPQAQKTQPGSIAVADAAPDPLKQVLDKHKAFVEMLGKGVRAALIDARAAPPVNKPEPLAKLLTEKPGLAATDMSPDTFIGTVDLIENIDAKPAFGLYPVPNYQDLEKLYRGKTEDVLSAASLDRELEMNSGVKYALLVRVRDYQPSKLTGTRLAPGRVAGDALFYELAGAKRLGAFPFAFQAPNDFKVEAGESPDQTMERLGYHLRDSVMYQLQDALGALATGRREPRRR